MSNITSNTCYVSTNIDDKWYLITAARTPASADHMLDILEAEFYGWFDVLSDRPSLNLVEHDYDLFSEYRTALVRPVPQARKQPKLVLIQGGLDS